MVMVDGSIDGNNSEVREMFPVPMDFKVTLAPTPPALRLTEAPVPISIPKVSISIFPVPLDFKRTPPAPDEIRLISPRPDDKTLNVDAPTRLNVIVSILVRLGELDEIVNFPGSPKMKFVSPKIVWSTVKLLLISTSSFITTSVVKIGSAISGASSIGLILRTTAPVPVAVVTPVPPFSTGRVPMVIPNIPDVVTVAEIPPLTCKNPPEGTLIPTEETPPPPPPPEGVCHDRLPAPLVVSTWPFVPNASG